MIRSVICAAAILSVVWFEPKPTEACGVKLSIGSPRVKRNVVAARQQLTPKRTSDARRPVRTGPALRLRGAVGAGGGEAVAATPTPGESQPPAESKPRKPRRPKVDQPVEKPAETTPPEPVTDKPDDTPPSKPDETAPVRPAGGTGKVASRGYFGNASSKISARFRTRLDETAAWMAKFPDKNITIEGHTSSVGNAALNQELSEKRAESVKEYLVDKGVDAGRITTRGVGPSKPAFSPGSNPRNRRVEITID